MKARLSKYDTAHKMKNTPFYNVYYAMRNRCANPKNTRYRIYGGRGIECEWKTFGDFKRDMHEGYLLHRKENVGTRATQIDRIDVNGNYCKSNCRWATKQEQSRNRRDRKLITHNGKSQLLSDWSKEVGVSIFTLYERIYYRKWPLEKALNPKKHINQFI